MADRDVETLRAVVRYLRAQPDEEAHRLKDKVGAILAVTALEWLDGSAAREPCTVKPGCVKGADHAPPCSYEAGFPIVRSEHVPEGEVRVLSADWCRHCGGTGGAVDRGYPPCGNCLGTGKAPLEPSSFAGGAGGTQ